MNLKRCERCSFAGAARNHCGRCEKPLHALLLCGRCEKPLRALLLCGRCEKPLRALLLCGRCEKYRCGKCLFLFFDSDRFGDEFAAEPVFDVIYGFVELEFLYIVFKQTHLHRHGDHVAEPYAEQPNRAACLV